MWVQHAVVIFVVQIIMQYCRDSKVKELILIHGEEEITCHVTGAVRNITLHNIAKMLIKQGCVPVHSHH